MKRLPGDAGNPHLPRIIMMVAAGVLALLTLTLHGSALQGFWRFDDTAILLYVAEYPSVSGYFFSPSQWQASGVPFFTPWLILDYWLDYTLFGLQPTAFYAHHLLVIWLAAVLTFVLLNRYAGPFWSSLASALFLLGAPVAVVGQQIMTRHYAMGLVFAILSMLFWLRGRESGGRSAPALAAGFYLLAMLNKEIYAPLPLLLLFLQDGTLKSRLGAMLLPGLAALAFVAWRSVMLGSVVGGYGGLNAASGLLDSLAVLPQVFFGAGSMVLTVGAALLSLSAWALYSGRRHIPLVFFSLAALLLPFLAIRASIHPVDLRFAFLPWWGVCALLALGFSSLPPCPGFAGERRFLPSSSGCLALLAFFAAATAAFLQSRDTAGVFDKLANPYDVQGRFMWSRESAVSYVPAGDMSGFGLFGYGTSALKKRLQGQGSPVAVPFAESALKLGAPLPVYVYDADCHCMKATSSSAGNEGMQTAMPMGISMNRGMNSLEWHIQSPAGASCFLTFREINTATAIPCSGKISFDLPRWLKGEFTFFVHTSEQRWNASPKLVFPERGAVLAWRSSSP